MSFFQVKTLDEFILKHEWMECGISDKPMRLPVESRTLKMLFALTSRMSKPNGGPGGLGYSQKRCLSRVTFPRTFNGNLWSTSSEEGSRLALSEVTNIQTYHHLPAFHSLLRGGNLL